MGAVIRNYLIIILPTFQIQFIVHALQHEKRFSTYCEIIIVSGGDRCKWTSWHCVNLTQESTCPQNFFEINILKIIKNIVVIKIYYW